MKRMMLAVVVMSLLAGRVAMGQVKAAGTGTAGEPEAVQLLRIDMRKALLEQEVSPRVTQARQAKFKYLQGANGTGKELADAEVDLIEAQAAEQSAGLTAKIVEAQLKEAIKNAAAMPARPAASATEISVLQMELQKSQLQADAAARVAENRRRVEGELRDAKANVGQLWDARADLEAAAANAALLALEVEAGKVRLDSATRAAGK